MNRTTLLAMSAMMMMFARSPMASAQQPASSGGLAWEPRVRVTVSGDGSGQVVGRYLRTAGDTIWIDTGLAHGPSPIVVDQIRRFEVSRGQRSNAGRGALIGGAVGLGIGLVSVISAASEDDGWFEPSTGEYAAGVAVLTAMGSGIGAGIGALIRTEKWEAVPVAGLTVTRGASPGLRLGLSMRF
jgi:hypothetical protein